MRLLAGIAGVIACAGWLLWAALRRPRPAGGAARTPAASGLRYPAYGWIAVAALLALEAMLAAGVPWVRTFFTALIWTAFIAAVDAAVDRLRGDSLLHHPGRFVALCLLSIPIWLIFEAYNLKLRNWCYVGVPQGFGQFMLGGSWAFATILPGIFEVADLLLAAGFFVRSIRPWRTSRGARAGLVVAGALCCGLPLALPASLAAYCFGPVWVGFALWLDPLNARLGQPALLRDLAAGRGERFWALLASGGICGFFWEFWNYWAAARWEYIFPIGQGWKLFAMPAPGFFGFPPFALECFALTSFASAWALPQRWRPLADLAGEPATILPPPGIRRYARVNQQR